mmetsp:Transcript_15465/g.37986  ORF Transcript_15465/g.37986 Transcript_15465/m.37986 type:complete len:353 (-) Transcript_15465:1605-2663(-)
MTDMSKAIRLANLCSVFATAFVVLTNKRILDHFHSPFFGGLLVPLHLLCTVLATCLAEVHPDRRIPVAWLLLNACVGVLSLFGSLVVLKYSTVKFQQIGRLFAVPTSALVDRYYWGTPAPTWSRLFLILGIMLGVLVVSFEIVDLSLLAIFGNFVAVGGQVGSQTIVKVIAGRFDVTSYQHLAQSSPYTCAIAMATVTTGWFLSDVSSKDNTFGRIYLENIRYLPSSIVLYVCVSCALGVSVQFLATWLSQKSSSVSYAMLTLIKTSSTIGAGAFFFFRAYQLDDALWSSLQPDVVLRLPSRFFRCRCGYTVESQTTETHNANHVEFHVCCAFVIFRLGSADMHSVCVLCAR